MEDCIQALYDNGASRVIFYAVGRTVKMGNTPSTRIGDAPEIDTPENEIDDEIFLTYDNDETILIDIDGKIL